jgi:lactase-phlorizin hydrolase
MKEKILEKSLQQGFEQSRLPEFTEEEVQRILGESPHLTLEVYYY